MIVGTENASQSNPGVLSIEGPLEYRGWHTEP